MAACDTADNDIHYGSSIGPAAITSNRPRCCGRGVGSMWSTRARDNASCVMQKRSAPQGTAGTHSAGRLKQSGHPIGIGVFAHIVKRPRCGHTRVLAWCIMETGLGVPLVFGSSVAGCGGGCKWWGCGERDPAAKMAYVCVCVGKCGKVWESGSNHCSLACLAHRRWNSFRLMSTVPRHSCDAQS
jgi:hypothetical protein